MVFAIYDLDRTLTRRPTFTPFLCHGAAALSPWRLMLVPVWIAAMAAYRAGVCSRTALKRFGMRLMLGRPAPADLAALAARFARRRARRPGFNAPVLALLEEDRAAGRTVVIATAAFAFYAREFARILDVETVIGTGWDGEAIPGGNCYGESKRARVLAWLADQGVEPGRARFRFVSDSFADAPLLDLAAEAVFVTRSPRQAARAARRGWRVMRP